MMLEVPGKLILLGEYAVLHKGQRGIVMATKKGVTLELLPSHDIGFYSEETGENFWIRQEPSAPVERVTFSYRAIEMTYAYLKEMGIQTQPFQMILKSSLNDVKSGMSMGLGSSAAVVVALVKGLLMAHHIKVDLEVLTFKLAYLVHRDIQGNGSGIDIAASTYGGLILYESPDYAWLEDFICKCKTLTEKVNTPWVGASVKTLKLPWDVGVTYAWSGEKASSRDLVKAYLEAGAKDPQAVFDFLEKTDKTLQAFEKACQEEDLKALFKAVKSQRIHLNQMAKALGLKLETPKLKKLCDHYEKHGAGKFSGAGGGDCAIGFYKK